MGNKATLTSASAQMPSRKHSAGTSAARRRSRLSWLVPLGLAAVSVSAALGYQIAEHQSAHRGAASGAWRGRVEKVVRGGADPSGGLTTLDANGARVPIGAGAEVRSGTTLVTDARTRARLAFDDGSSIVLDRATTVTFGALPGSSGGWSTPGRQLPGSSGGWSTPGRQLPGSSGGWSTAEGARTLRVIDGALLADVAPSPSAEASCTVQTPTGDLKTSGAKFAVAATEDRASVEVLRGDVDVMDHAGGSARASAGQEATTFKNAPLEVTSANDLGRRVAFGDGFAGEHNEDADAAVSGLGELRARRPGSAEEKDHAVRLARHAVKVRIAGNFARTEIDETFANDTDQVLEGVYRFPIPPDAQIERLALEVDGALVDGAFVEKGKAAAIFRGAIHNATPLAPKPAEELIWVPGPWRDPALLEWQRGGRSELKIFPIPKHGSRRIVLAYTETIAPVAGVRRYVYPLPQATASDIRIDAASMDVQVLGADPSVPVRARGYELAPQASAQETGKRFTQSMTDFTPTGDLVIEYALADRASDVTAWSFKEASASATDGFVALALRPKLPAWSDARPRDQVIVLDGGRAMFGERLQRAKRLAIAMTQEMDRRDRVTVLVCDVTCKAMPGGFHAPGSGAAHDVDAFLALVKADGASDLVGAVRAAVAVRDRDGKRDLRVVLISDGVASAGYRRGDRVAAEVRDALPDGRALVVSVPVGTDADVATLREIARGGGGVVVPYQPGEKLETAAIEALGATYGITLRDVELTLPDGLEDSSPRAIAPLRAGSETIIAARMKGDHVKGDVVLRGKVGGEPFEARYAVDVTTTSDDGNAFVPRLFASMRIADQERDGGDATKAESVALSQRYGVPSRFTSLLVLESEAMFSAFGVDRNAKTAPAWSGESVAQSSGQDDAALGKGDEEESDKKLRTLRALGAMDVNSANDSVVSGSMSFGSGSSGYAVGGPAGGRSASESAGLSPSSRAFESMSPVAAGPTATMAPPPSPPPHASAVVQQKDLDALMEAARRQPQWSPPPRFRGGQWMKRVWFRTSTIAEDSRPVVDDAKIALARSALRASPDERRKHMELVQLLTRDGSEGELDEELARWSERDPLDEGATFARADLLERRGDRDEGLRVLGGVVASGGGDSPDIFTMLALSNERAGHAPEACAFRVAAAEVRPTDVELVAAAVACERAAGRYASASRWLDGGAGAKIEAAIAKLGGERASDRVGFGDVRVDATWDDGSGRAIDLDLAVVDPSGHRFTWAGRSQGLRAADCTSRFHEALALSSQASGAFVVEIVRGGSLGRDSQSGPVTGKLRVTSVGAGTRVIPFALASGANRVQVARIDYRWESSLVAAGDSDIPRRTWR